MPLTHTVNKGLVKPFQKVSNNRSAFIVGYSFVPSKDFFDYLLVYTSHIVVYLHYENVLFFTRNA
jgi:hypothetical protein